MLIIWIFEKFGEFSLWLLSFVEVVLNSGGFSL